MRTFRGFFYLQSYGTCSFPRIFCLWLIVSLAGITALPKLTPSVSIMNVENPLGGANSASVGKADEQPYGFHVSPDRPGYIGITVEYRPWQNGAFTLSPFDGCIGRIWRLSDSPSQARVEIFRPAHSQCDEFSVNLTHALKDGGNRLAVEVFSHSNKMELWCPGCKQSLLGQYSGRSDMGLFAGPQWVGGNAAVTGIVLCMFTAFALAMAAAARCAGLDLKVAVMLFSAVCYYEIWLHFRSSLVLTNDVYGHIAYALYMAAHWDRPFDYLAQENWHPFPFYFILGHIAAVGTRSLWVSPVTLLHLASLPLYMVFCIYGLKTLQTLSLARGMVYRIAAFMLLFWPLSITTATRINNDIAVDAVWAALLYYLTRWMQRRALSDLGIALALAGGAICLKSNGLIPLATLAATVAYATLRQGFEPQALKDRALGYAWCLLVAGIAFNIAKPCMHFFLGDSHSYGHFGQSGHEYPSLFHFLLFTPYDFITSPFFMPSHELLFTNYFLKTILYGDDLSILFKDGFPMVYLLDHDGILPSILPISMALARSMNFALLLLGLAIVMAWRSRQEITLERISLVFYLLCFVINVTLPLLLLILDVISRIWQKRLPAEYVPLIPHLLCLLLSIGTLICFMLEKHWVVTENFRFIYPCLICLLTLFMRGLELTQTHGTGLWIRPMGIMLGIGLPVMGALLFFLSI